MAKFCGRCGTRLDEATGLCPNCDRAILAELSKKRKKSSGGAKRFFVVLGVILLVLILLAGALLALDYFEVIDLPVDRVTQLWERPEQTYVPEEEEDPETLPEETEAPAETEEIPVMETEPETEPTLPVQPQFLLKLETMELSYVDNPVSHASASSTYSGDLATHDVLNLLDGDPKTNWTEGASGLGLGEYLEFQFGETCQLNSVTIRGGNHFSKQRYLDNARPENVTLTFSNGAAQTFTISDVMEPQELVLQAPIMTSSVRITIDSAYSGRKYADTVISEISFEAYTRQSETVELPTEETACASVQFRRYVSGGKLSAVMTGSDASGMKLWSYESGTYNVAQSPAVEVVGAHGDTFYFVENGIVKALALEDGSLRWENKDFGGYPSAHAFGEDGSLYLSGYFTPDFFAMDGSGNTVQKIKSFHNDLYWACDMILMDHYAVIKMEGHPDDMEPEKSMVRVDLTDFSYELPER